MTAGIVQRQSLVKIVDEIARSRPHSVYGYFPRSSSGYKDGFYKLTYRQLANAVNGLAWWMAAQLGKCTASQTLLYVGDNDFMQNIMLLACAKTGYKLLLVSPRNQLESLRSLIEETKCEICLAANLQAPFARLVQEAQPMLAFQTPALQNLADQRFPQFPYNSGFEDIKDDPVVILHTSGTTTLPKPVVYTNDWVAAYIASLQLQPDQNDLDQDLKVFNMKGVRFLIMMPPYHAANIFCTSFIAPALQTTIIIPPAKLPICMETFLEAIQTLDIDVAFVPPHFITQLATNEKHLQILETRLDTLISGGGRISDTHGDIVSSRVKLVTLYGATETGSIPEFDCSVTRRDLWNYIRPHSAAQWEFRPYRDTGEKNVYEAWIIRGDHESSQPVFKLFPNVSDYCTRDLFVPHPELQGYWKWSSRIDETICLSTGANVSPAVMERGLIQDPTINAALMVGNGYARPCLIVEPHKPCGNSKEKEDYVLAIWRSVETMNSRYFPDHRILKEYIIVTDENKPMARSLKGIVQRKMTISLYEAIIQGLYDSV
ncbi:hypothetical protein N0V90_002141 [Kalmusia sp. IMI 367209]|nr:hypothetical protein N0V90_002141 [Kalmusia sp. IMI 367209]